MVTRSVCPRSSTEGSFSSYNLVNLLYARPSRRVLRLLYKSASLLWSHLEETRELPGERDNARNNAMCTKVRKATHGLDGQHQDVDRTGA